MKSIPLENPDVRFGAPSNWNHETDGICHTLDVWRRDGAWISGWVPSAAELAKLNAGEPLFLHIFNDSHPVIGFSVGYARPEAPATSPVKCPCGKPNLQSCHNPDCQRPA